MVCAECHSDNLPATFPVQNHTSYHCCKSVVLHKLGRFKWTKSAMENGARAKRKYAIVLVIFLCEKCTTLNGGK